MKAENFTKALSYFRICKKLVFEDQKPNSYNLPILFNSIGVAYFNLNQTDSALHYINNAYHKSLKKGDTVFAVQSLGNIARISDDQDLIKLESIIFQLNDLLPAIDKEVLKGHINLTFAEYYLKKMISKMQKIKLNWH